MVNYSSDDRMYHIGVRPTEVGRYVILPGDPKRSKLIAEYFDKPTFVADNREYTTYSGYLDGEKVSVCSTGIGGPSASIAMEELVKCGAHTFIRVGTCGGIDIDVKSKDIVIASGAVRMEGTSKEYAPIEWPAVADHSLVEFLIEAAKDLKQSYHVGVVECKDSFYGQHEPEVMPVSYELENKWEAWKRLHCKASEMESAALYVVASFLNVRCATVLTVFANQEREKLGLPNEQDHDTNRAIKVAIEALRKVIKSDKERNEV